MSIQHDDSRNPAARKPRVQFTLKTLLLVMLISAVMLLAHRERTKSETMLRLSQVKIEMYTDQKSFEKRLGGVVRCIDFEDVDTSAKDVVPVKSRHYANEGVVLKSAGGLYVGRTYGYPRQYPPKSGTNSFAPGPLGKNPGGNTTDVTFEARQQPALVAGVGITFIDADYPSIGASKISVFGWDKRLLAKESGFRTANAESLFRGFVAVDANGNVIPAISRAQLINGTGWPGVDAGDGVVLDDLVFGVPEVSGVQ